MLRIIGIVVCLSVLAPAWAARPEAQPPGDRRPEGRVRRAKRPVAGQYIVVLRETVEGGEVEAAAARLLYGHGGVALHHYRHALKGFAARMSEQAALALSRHPLVAFIEEDGYEVPSATQADPPNWGLDRIDQRSLPLNSAYSYQTTGAGVNAYVIDSGLNFGHPDFAGRAFFAAEFAAEPTGGWDCNGHGTAVASVLGGSRYGVAKEVTLHIVRVSGSTYHTDADKDDGLCAGGFNVGQAVAALDWVTANHRKPAVVNLSWEQEPAGVTAFDLSAVDVAARKLIAAGVTLVNSAGNDNTDVSASHPACLPEVLVVGAVNEWDSRYLGVNRKTGATTGSNYGYTVDVHAPGVSVRAPGALGWEVTEWSGTSFAAPQVAGVAARYLQTNPSATPAQVESYIVGTATPNKVRGLPGPEPFYPATPNRLLFAAP